VDEWVAVLIGVVCGILAGIPTSYLLLSVLVNRQQTASPPVRYRWPAVELEKAARLMRAGWKVELDGRCMFIHPPEGYSPPPPVGMVKADWGPPGMTIWVPELGKGGDDGS
jgi:hypothetical protein